MSAADVFVFGPPARFAQETPGIMDAFCVCPYCGQRNPARHIGACLFCGAPLGNAPVELAPVVPPGPDLTIASVSRFDTLNYAVWRFETNRGPCSLKTSHIAMMGTNRYDTAVEIVSELARQIGTFFSVPIQAVADQLFALSKYQ